MQQLIFWTKQRLIKVRHRRYIQDRNWPQARRITPRTTEETISQLTYAVEWLGRCQDAHAFDGGVAAGFQALTRSWSPSYPETSGYIIPTFLKAAKWVEDESALNERCHRIAEWLLSIQTPSGAWIGGFGGEGDLSVFNTAQIIQGLVAMHGHTGSDRYIASAIRGGEWLVSIQDEDGQWNRNIYDLDCRTYYARAAWPLVQLGVAIGEVDGQRFIYAGAKFTNWLVQQINGDDYIERSGFFTDSDEWPVLHTLAYTIEGLWEVGVLTNNDAWKSSAKAAGERLMDIFEIRGHIPGEISSNWKPLRNYSSITGVAQTSLIWARIFQETGDVRFLDASLRANDALCQVQVNQDAPIQVRGALHGSLPPDGPYMPYLYPNWAAKFFCDALLLELELLRVRESSHQIGPKSQ